MEREVSAYKILELALKHGMITMAQDGLLKALDGLTSVDEVLAVANTDTLVTEPEVVAPELTPPPIPPDVPATPPTP